MGARDPGDDAAYAVVMAGGSGTRFWPASRAARPKQLLPLLGDAEPGPGNQEAHGRSLLAATVRRIRPLFPASRTFIVTSASLVDVTRREAPDLPAENVLAEPAPRNTAPCIGWATRVISARSPDAIVAVLPSDHYVRDERAFQAAITSALDAARSRTLATIGIRPTRPDTGFGYIEVGAPIPGGDASEVERFVEKPDAARAHEFVGSGRFLWNSGMFFFRARAMEESIRKHLPELARGLDEIARSPGSLATVFPTLPSISVDFGIAERVSAEGRAAGRPSIAVVPGDFGWSDVGSWESAWELATKDDLGNAMPPGAVAIDARGNIARTTSGKLVALLGVDNLVVVDTPDALLVMPRHRAQDVRAVVDALKASGRGEQT